MRSSFLRPMYKRQTWNDPSPEQAARIEAIGRPAGQSRAVTETVSMARSASQRVPQMVAVKGVDPAVYPFYGKLTLDPDRRLRELLRDDSSVVVTPELLTRLRVKRGRFDPAWAALISLSPGPGYGTGPACFRLRSGHARADEPPGARPHGPDPIRKPCVPALPSSPESGGESRARPGPVEICHAAHFHQRLSRRKPRGWDAPSKTQPRS